MSNHSRHSPAASDETTEGQTIHYYKSSKTMSPIDPGDDPMSGDFRPLDKRTAIDQARFWAIMSSPWAHRPKTGVFDV